MLPATQAQLRKDRWALNEDNIQVTCLPSNHLGNYVIAQRDISQLIKDKLYSSHQLQKKKKSAPHQNWLFCISAIGDSACQTWEYSYSPYPESSDVWLHLSDGPNDK